MNTKICLLFLVATENSKMGDEEKIWKVIFLKSDQSFTVLKDQNVKNQVIFDEKTHNVKVKFGSKWFDGQIVGSGESMKIAEEVLVQLEEKLIKGSGKIL